MGVHMLNRRTFLSGAAASAIVGPALAQSALDAPFNLDSVKSAFSRRAIDVVDPAERARRVAWLGANTLPLRTIDMADDNFSDLAPLRTAIGDARIVLLGEQTHGDGTTF